MVKMQGSSEIQDPVRRPAVGYQSNCRTSRGTEGGPSSGGWGVSACLALSEAPRNKLKAHRARRRASRAHVTGERILGSEPAMSCTTRTCRQRACRELRGIVINNDKDATAEQLPIAVTHSGDTVTLTLPPNILYTPWVVF